MSFWKKLLGAEPQENPIGPRGTVKVEGLRNPNYAKIPQACRASFTQLVDSTYEQHKDRFPKKEDYSEALAGAWNENKEAFDALAKAHGFEAFPRALEGARPVLNNYEILYFTATGACFMTGKDAFNSAKGGDMRYASLREPVLTPGTYTNVVVENVPKVGESVHFTSGNFTSPTTSPLVDVRVKRIREDNASSSAGIIQEFHETSRAIAKKWHVFEE